MVVFKAVEQLYLMLFMSALFIVGIALRKHPFFSSLRRLPCIDALEEAVDLCAERGRPFFAACGTATFTGHPTSLVGQLHALSFIAERSAKLNVRVVTDTSDPNVQVAVVDFVRQGYIRAGVPERFRIDDQIYSASTAAQLDCVDVVESIHPGTVFTGIAMSPVVLDAGVRQGAFLIAFGTWPDQSSDQVTLADHLIIQAEMIAAGAYLSKDPLQTGCILGEDLAKLSLFIALIGGMILALAGVRI
mgnify:CR=1 FL=1